MTALDVRSTAFAVDIRATTDVDAPADQVWAVLADHASYPEWNPFVRKLTGSLVVGERLVVALQPEGEKITTLKPRVVEFTDGRAFAWLGHFGLPGLLDGRHRFEVSPIEAGRSRLVQSERLSGALVPVVRSMLTGASPKAFVAMNDALAERVLDRARGQEHRAA